MTPKRAKKFREGMRDKLTAGTWYYVRGDHSGNFEGLLEAAHDTFATFVLRNGEKRDVNYGIWLTISPTVAA